MIHTSARERRAGGERSTLIRGLAGLSLAGGILLLPVGNAAAVDVDVPLPSPASVTRSAPPAPGAGPQSAATAAAAAATRSSAPIGAAMAQRTTVSAVAIAPGLRALRSGMRGLDVRSLQRALRTRGAAIRPDGVYGGSTAAAVRRVQRALGLRPTGIADRTLLRRLGISTDANAAPVLDAPAAPAPTAEYVKVFPVQVGSGVSYNYTDTYGAARHQGAHQGTDIMAPRGAALVAVANGVIERLTRVETGLGGIWIWLRDGSGNTFYYAHLDSIAPGLEAGSRVTAGQPIGTVGNTGDARHGDPHLHFEVHPGGGGAINPYPGLVAVDPARR